MDRTILGRMGIGVHGVAADAPEYRSGGLVIVAGCNGSGGIAVCASWRRPGHAIAGGRHFRYTGAVGLYLVEAPPAEIA